jgi:hypothetical protein
MHISGSCCPFFHTSVAEGMVKVNVPDRKPLFLHLDVNRRGTMNKLVTPPGRFKWNLQICSNAASGAAGGGHHTYIPIRPASAYHPSGLSQEVLPIYHQESTHSINADCSSTAVRAKGMNVSMSSPPMNPFSISPWENHLFPGISFKSQRYE